MSSNTRQRKGYMAKQTTSKISSFNLTKDEEMEVMTLSLKQLNLYDQFQFKRKPTKAGRKLIPLSTRQVVWDFWHENSMESTNTNQVAKQKLTDQTKYSKQFGISINCSHRYPKKSSVLSIYMEGC